MSLFNKKLVLRAQMSESVSHGLVILIFLTPLCLRHSWETVLLRFTDYMMYIFLQFAAWRCGKFLRDHG